jgi:hypothetical protein
VLAETFGRLAGGPAVADDKGVCSHLYEAESMKPGKPKVVKADPVNTLAFRAPLWDVRDGDCTSPFRLSWTLTRKNKKSDVLIHKHGLQFRAVLIVNDKPVDVIEPIGPGHIVIDSESLSRSAVVQLALIPTTTANYDTIEEVERVATEISTQLVFEELVENLTEKSQWAFAKWEPPSATDFHTARTGKAKEPTWWKSTFKAPVTQAPAFIELGGLTKGQLYLNGRHLCRYFVATADGKDVGPQDSFLLPSSWLRAGEENEVMLFDEHGGHPTKVRISFESHAHPVLAAIHP